jgi:hypothetical protein
MSSQLFVHGNAITMIELDSTAQWIIISSCALTMVRALSSGLIPGARCSRFVGHPINLVMTVETSLSDHKSLCYGRNLFIRLWTTLSSYEPLYWYNAADHITLTCMFDGEWSGEPRRLCLKCSDSMKLTTSIRELRTGKLREWWGNRSERQGTSLSNLISLMKISLSQVPSRLLLRIETAVETIRKVDQLSEREECHRDADSQIWFRTASQSSLPSSHRISLMSEVDRIDSVDQRSTDMGSENGIRKIEFRAKGHWFTPVHTFGPRVNCGWVREGEWAVNWFDCLQHANTAAINPRFHSPAIRCSPA